MTKNKEEKIYIKIFKNKNGEWDFGVSGLCATIKREELSDFRSITVTAIYVAEDMWRRQLEKELTADIKNHDKN